MQTAQKKSPLLDVLATLELLLETPVVAGEMESWVQSIDQGYAAVDAELTKVLAADHPEKLKEITEQDPDMFRHATELEAKDALTREKQQTFSNLLNNLAGRAAKMEPDELRLEDRIDKLIQAGLDFIIHTRTQEVTVDYWLLEAMDRDQGGGD
jgi:hypothetical protein